MKRLRTKAGGGIGTAGATLLAPISWGTTYVVITELLPAGRPLLIASARVVPAGLALLALAALSSRRHRLPEHPAPGTCSPPGPPSRSGTPGEPEARARPGLERARGTGAQLAPPFPQGTRVEPAAGVRARSEVRFPQGTPGEPEARARPGLGRAPGTRAQVAPPFPQGARGEAEARGRVGLRVRWGRGVGGWRRAGVRGGEWGRTAVLALFNFGLFFPLLAVAVYRLPGGVAAAVGGLQPLLVAVVAWLAIGRRPRGRELAVGAAAVLGVALVVVRPGAAFDAVGVLAAVGANVSFSIGVVLTKRFPPPADRLAATGRQLLLGGVLLVPLTLVVEGLPPLPDGAALAGFAYLGLGATALAFVLWFNGVRRLPTAAPPLLGLAAPVTGATLGWALLGQSLSPLQLAGFALTLAAIAYGAGLGATPEPSPPNLVVASPAEGCHRADATSPGRCAGSATLRSDQADRDKRPRARPTPVSAAAGESAASGSGGVARSRR